MEATKSLPARLGVFIDWDDPFDSTYFGLRGEVNGEMTYSIRAHNLGIELWISGGPRSIAVGNREPPDLLTRASDLPISRWQQWALQCDYPGSVASSPNTSCSLERTRLDVHPESAVGTIPAVHKHDTSNDTLTVTRVDWEAGILDLAGFIDRAVTDVEIRFVYSDDSMYLDSLRGSGADGAVVYRVASYDYTLNAPFVMQGLRAAGQEPWNEMFRSLSASDQEAWFTFRQRRDEFREEFHRREEEMLRVRGGLEPGDVPEAEIADAMTAAMILEWYPDVIETAYVEAFRSWIEQSNVSAEGRTRMLDYLAASVQDR